ncbi:Protein ALP1-like [Linum perenne]
MIVMFLWTIGHNTKNRIIQLRFGRSGKTVCAVIHAVLSALLKLHRTLYRIPIIDVLQNCLGALDGTHVKVRAIIPDQPRYRNRKGEVSINMLAVCNPDCEFMYCLAGWEGSAHDGRVLRDAVSRPNGLRVPKGIST